MEELGGDGACGRMGHLPAEQTRSSGDAPYDKEFLVTSWAAWRQSDVLDLELLPLRFITWPK